MPDGKRLIVAGRSAVAAIYDLGTGKELAVLKDPEIPAPPLGPNPSFEERMKAKENLACHLTLSRDGKWLAAATEGGWVSVWDVEKRKRLWRERLYVDEVRGLSISPDGKWVASRGVAKQKEFAMTPTGPYHPLRWSLIVKAREDGKQDEYLRTLPEGHCCSAQQQGDRHRQYRQRPGVSRLVSHAPWAMV